MVVVWTLLGLVLLRFIAVAAIGLLVIRPIDTCPACFATLTLPVHRRIVRLLGSRFEWRWCPTCGWQALVRKSPR